MDKEKIPNDFFRKLSQDKKNEIVSEISCTYCGRDCAKQFRSFLLRIWLNNVVIGLTRAIFCTSCYETLLKDSSKEKVYDVDLVVPPDKNLGPSDYKDFIDTLCDITTKGKFSNLVE